MPAPDDAPQTRAAPDPGPEPGSEPATDTAAVADTGPLRLRYTALSDVGRVRKDNQDSGYAGPHLLLIADGVGGSARGDVASSAAVAALADLDHQPDLELQVVLERGITAAHQRIAGLVKAHPELDGTSTTVTAALFDGHQVGIGHVGDSRAYLLREGRIYQLTKDHTFVQSLVDEGRITEQESRVHPHRNMILRAVDGVHEAEPDLFAVEVAPGDRLLLCSDGASGVLENPELGELIGAGTVEAAAVTVIRQALERGSTDNVTVVLADVVDTHDEDPDETQGLLVGPVTVGAAAEPARPLASADETGEIDELTRQAMDAEDGVETGAPATAAGTPSGSDPALEDRLVHGGPDHRDPEEIRYAPRERGRFGWVGRVVAVAVVAVLLWLAGTTAYAWSQRQYFVAPSRGQVAIYQGLEANVPLLRLHSVHDRSAVAVSDLPDYYKQQVRAGMSARNLAGARAIVERLRSQACGQGDGAGTTSTPSASPSVTPTPSATTSARPRVSGSAAAPTRTTPATPATPTTPTTPSTPASTLPTYCTAS